MNMNKKAKIIIFTFISFFVLISSIIAGYAYYEYYGQYSTIVNFNGTIKVDAFDYLYLNLRNDSTYGTTPENPYVIDNVTRLQNLIKLNNSGRLKNLKENQGIEKFYFCLEFDEQDVAQVLNLAEEGEFSSIGCNEYPFEDELSGVVYGYTIGTDVVYYSGCLPQVTVTYVDSTYYIDGVETAIDFSSLGGTGTYLIVSQGYSYDEDSYASSSSISFDTDAEIKYIPLDTESGTDVTTIHQIIANETVVADLEQLDVGFISSIGATGYVHDLILYNTTIECKEEVAGGLHDSLLALISNLFSSHNNANSDHSDERHIGIFAGHIDGAAANISVAGASNIIIDTEEVNYYSNYTTVGYIDDEAYIGGVKLSELASDAFTGGTGVSGCLFADNIYEAVLEETESTTTTDGATSYKLVDVSADSEYGWPGVTDSSYFEYGSFTFLLSSSSDLISSIWSGEGELYLLQQEGYTINGTVLYINDEYRYSSTASSGSSIVDSAASAKESEYASVSALSETGNVVDAGTYLIVAVVDDEYYALKLYAIEDSSGSIKYDFDESSSINVTDFINDTTGNVNVLQSCLWTVDQASTTPSFENSRYSGEYLTASTSVPTLSTTSGKSFIVDIENNLFYYTVTDDDGSIIQYYLTFDKDDLSFSFSTTSISTIEIYNITNGYTLEMVTETSDFEEGGNYIIVAVDGSQTYLIGLNYSDNTIYNSFTTPYTGFNSTIPSTITVSEYNDIINYIWSVNTISGTLVSFIDRASYSYYLSQSSGTLAASATALSWTATISSSTGVGTYYNSSYYLSYDADSEEFIASTTAYSIYIYRIVPEDSTPTYITYDGATYVDANASTVDAGTYVIAAYTGSTYYALGTSTTGYTFTPSSASLGTAYQWTLSEQTDNPAFINSSTSKYLYSNNSTISTSSSSFNWMYDSAEYRLYYYVDSTKYYLALNGTTFVVTSDSSLSYTYDIQLYEVETQYTYSGVTRITSGLTNWITHNSNANYGYLISTGLLTDGDSSQYLVGCNDISNPSGWSSNLSTPSTYNITGNYSLSGTTMTTTEDLSNYTWWVMYNGGTSTGVHLYLASYGSTNNYEIYLAASSENKSRVFKLYYSSSYNTGNSGVLTRAGYGTDVGGEYGLGFVGKGKTYFIVRGTTADAIQLNDVSDTSFSCTASVSGNPMYYYYYTSMAESTILTLISSLGDTLEEDIHYVIAAKTTDNKYMALTYNTDVSQALYGTDMTNTISTIISYGSYTNTTNVPTYCDWIQNSSTNALTFINTAYSNDNYEYYLNYSSSSFTITSVNISNNDTYTGNSFYYDKVNKYFKYIDSSDNVYYLVYDSDNNTYSFTTTEASASEIILIRYTPTYKVEEVTDGTNLSSGQFIIAYHADDGYYALGTNGSILSTNLTYATTALLSEETYQSIFNYLWNQYYYTVTDTSASPTTASAIMEIAVESGSGTIFAIYSSEYKLSASSGTFAWTVAYDSTNNGWTFVNCTAYGNTTKGTIWLAASGGTASSALTMTDEGMSIDGYLGSWASSYYTAEDDESDASMTVIYKYDSSTDAYSLYTGDLTVGDQYILFVNDGTYYYIVGSNGSSGLTRTKVGSTINGYTVAENNILTAYSSGDYGVSLKFTSDSYYLTLSSSIITTSDTLSTYWMYSYNDVYTNKSRLYAVSTNSVSSSLLTVSGSKVYPYSTSGISSETYLYSVSYSDDTYTLGSLATSVTSGNYYAIVIYQNNCYYVLTEKDGDITSTYYGTGLPTTLDSSLVFMAGGSSGAYTFASVNTSTYLTIGTDKALALGTNAGTFSYSGSTGTAVTFTHTETSSNASYLTILKVSVDDELDNTTDVEATFTGKSKIAASLSINDSTNYIIVAESDGKYYALSMSNAETSKAIDITDEFSDALTNGGTINLFKASTWNQLGSGYSLIFDSNGFASYEEEGDVYEATAVTIGDSVTANTYYVVSGSEYVLTEDEIFQDGTTYYIKTTGSISYNDYYLLYGALESLNNGSPITINVGTALPSNVSLYTWTIYTYTDNGNGYIIGYYDETSNVTYYLYFDSSANAFKTTTDASVAKESTNLVQIYQLGQETNSLAYQTFEITLADDGVTIESFSLNEAAASDITAFSSASTSSTITGLVDGEYLIGAEIDGEHYTLSFNSSGELEFVDITILYSGNFLKDTSGNYCISINTEYLWKQTNDVSYNSNTLIASNLSFTNFADSTIDLLSLLSASATEILYSGGQLYTDDGYYLNFSVADGFTVSNQESSVDIKLYSVGVNGVASGDTDAPQYTYFAFGLNTSAVDYSDFAFDIVSIPDLVNYSLTYSGSYDNSTGWNLTSDTYLETVNSSVYFTTGITYDSDVEDFDDTFVNVSTDYTLYDDETETSTAYTISYYAPTGLLSFVIPEASIDSPVFVNVIVTTEMDSSCDEATNRFLSLWKIAEVSGATATTLDAYSSSNSSASAYAYTLLNKFYTPDSAIYLPNNIATSSTSSYVKVNTGYNYTEASVTLNAEITANTYYVYDGSTDSYSLTSDETFQSGITYYTRTATTTNYNLTSIGYAHLIAHTFTISSPGIYYLGSTNGTITYSYISIDTMYASDQGEDGSTVISDDFTIDFVWGEVASSNDDFSSDGGTGTIAYVGRTSDTDSLLTWTNSNIYPEFVNGMAGLYEVTYDNSAGTATIDESASKPNGYNPTDYLKINVIRTYTVATEDDSAYSTTAITAYTTEEIYAEGEGIEYINSNSKYQRQSRKVTLIIYNEDGSETYYNSTT